MVVAIELGRRYPQIAEALEACKAADTYAFDCETSSYNPFRAKIIGFSVAVDTQLEPAKCPYNCCPTTLQVPKSWYFQFVPSLATHLSNEEAMRLYAEECVPMRDTLQLFEREVFKEKKKRAVMHNGKFDYKFLRRAGIAFKNELIDTCVASWITDENQTTHKLKDLVKKELGHDMIRFDELDGLFSPSIQTYGADDARQTIRLWRKYEKVIKEEKLERAFYELECRIPTILAEMELRGVAINVETLQSMRKEIHAESLLAEEECFKLAGRRFSLTSPGEISALLFNILKWRQRGEIKKHKTTGVLSTDKNVLERYADKPLAGGILKHREIMKLESTYIDPLSEAAQAMDGRVRSQFCQIPHPYDGAGGTVTGRLSSRADEELGGTQLQNIPSRSKVGKKIKNAFVAAPGKVFIYYDYSQIELRVMAHYSQDQTLLDAYQCWDCVACGAAGRTILPLHNCPKCSEPDGHRVHNKECKVCATITKPKNLARHGFCLGLDIHQITADACSVDRQIGKIINFALLYGLGANGLARNLKISVAEASKIRNAYFKKYSGIGAHNNRIASEVMRYGYITTITGRRRRFPEKHGKKLELWDREWRQAANTKIQGSAADIMKIGMRNIQRRFDAEGISEETGMVLQCHDAIIVECPEAEEEYMRGLVREELEHVLQLRVPLTVDGKSGRSWGTCA